MVVRIGMAPRNANLSIEQAQQHWRGRHGKLALELPGVRRYVQLHALLRDGRPLLPHPGFDICAVTEYESVEAMDAAFTSSAYRGDVQDDEQQLLDSRRFHLLLCERRQFAGYEPPSPTVESEAVQLWTFLRGRPDVPAATLADQLQSTDYGLPRSEVLVHRELFVVAPEAHAGRRPPACECVEALWFPDQEHALDFVYGETGQAAAARLSETVFGRERLLARAERMR